ncbi:MAG TPA: endonuclease/exonuclease/phosphatase family protein [Thermomicrobiales bacterium]|nr:endonuclease/exonuclease/phosphatase family protein [Thermomicrobiales bacterium]
MKQDDATISIPQIVTVATMNVGNGMAPDDQLVKVVRQVQPDILAFEELNHRQAEHLAEKLADIWAHQFSFGDGYEGRAIFSRFPLLRQEMLPITSDRPDGLVEVELDGQALTIIVGHPRPPKFRGRGLETPYSSHRQLLRLADIAVERSPAVLLGDFNVRPDNGIYERLRQRGLVDAFAESGEGPERTFPVRVANEIRTFGRRTVRVKTPPVFRADYIWHTPDIRSVATWVGADTGSDHLPVVSRLAIPPKP